MPPNHESPLRASDADREAAVGRLRVAAMEGRLDAEELAERVSAAYDAKFCSDLDRLTADVTPSPTAPVHHGPPVFQAPARHTNGLAVAALILGILWMGWIGSILAVVLGHISLRQIARARGAQTGRGAAIVGIAFGYFGLLTLVLTIIGAIVD